MSNQSDTREQAYNAYKLVAASDVSKAKKDDAWATYLVALSKDPGAAQAAKRH